MLPTTDDARRLYDALVCLRDVWQPRNGEPAWAILAEWAQRLRPEGTEPVATEHDGLILVTRVAALPGSVITSLEQIGARELKWARPRLEHVAEAMASMHFLVNNWGASTGWLHDANLQAIEAASVALREADYRVEHDLPDELLGALLASVRAAQRILHEGDSLDLEFRAFATDLLCDIERAIHHYRIGGVEALRDVLDRAAGRWQTSGWRKRSSKATKVLLVALAGVAGVVEVAANVTTIRDAEGLPWSREQAPQIVVNAMPDRPALGAGTPALPSGKDPTTPSSSDPTEDPEDAE